MTTVNAYLNFNGNCEEAFLFYQSVFGGEFSYLGRFSEMPQGESSKPIPAEEANRIMHVCLPISKETMLMGSDVGGDWAPNFNLGNNITLSIHARKKEEADRLFSGLSAGGTVTMPMNQTFWGDYFGMFIDKFGINWMVSHNPKMNTGE
ncbi:MAG: VOC family protein [Flavobacteriales bacterium]|nr:VOC family protein [Flavobacteriales bacterium]MCB9447153.1 VOC family protein [Flavobacteriales bacterium]